MLALGQSTPTPYGDIQAQSASTRGRELGNETALLTLMDLKRKQASEEEVMAAIQKNPELAKLIFGEGPVLGSIGPAGGMPAPGGPPAPGPITQSPLGGGPAQTIPAPPDASRFANVPPTGGGPIPPNVMGQVMPTVTAPQGPPGVPTLATLGPQGGMPGAPQGAMQGPQNPVLEMARTNPRAAMMMQQQIEGRQEAAMKRQEQNLKLGAATLGYVGQQAQGVTDQAGLDALRSDLQSQGLGKYAAQLPHIYSKEAMQPFIAKALDVKEALTLQVQDLTAQAALRKTQVDALIQQQKMGEVEYKDTPDGLVAVPKYPGTQGQGGTGVGGTPVMVGGQPVGSLQGQKRLDEKQQQTRQAEMGLQVEYNKLAKPYMEVRDAMGRIEAAGTSPTAAGDAALLTAYMKMLDPTTGVRNEEIRNAENVGGLPQRAIGWLEWLKGGAPLKDDVRKDFMDRAKKLYEQYQKDYEQNATQYREQATRQGLDPRNVVQDYRSTTPGGGRTGGSGQGGNTFTDADIAATLANPANKGKTRQQVIDAALAKGLTYKER